MTTATTTKTEIISPPPSLSLHDSICLGEIELGLDKRIEKNNEQRKKQQYCRSVEEIHRLPYLLRILSRTRPLATIQSFDTMKKMKELISKSKMNEYLDDTSSGQNDDNHIKDDEIDRLVDCLEDVAATYSVSEAVDVVTNYLAPSLAKTLSRMPSLVRKTYDSSNSKVINNEGLDDVTDNYQYHWDTQKLIEVARDPTSKRLRKLNPTTRTSNKKRKNGHDGKGEMVKDNDAAGDALAMVSSDDGYYDDGVQDDDIPMNVDTEEDVASDTGMEKRTLRRRDSMKVAAEDTQESTVIKILSELASLVVASLEPTTLLVDPNQERNNHDEGDGDGDEEDQKTAPRQASSMLTLNTDDSILSEKKSRYEGGDLCSTIVAIMHHANILQCRHVANAFCRGSIPQVGELMSQLGANCPASVQSLLLGCIDAYLLSVQYHHRMSDSDGTCREYTDHEGKISSLSCPVVNAAKSGVIALAQLSETESSRVRTKLQSLGVMKDVQIKLSTETMADNTIPVACLIMEYLTFSTSSDKMTIIPFQQRKPAEDFMIDTERSKDAVLSYSVACSNGIEPSLLFHFVKNPDLYIHTLNFFHQTLIRDSPFQSKCKTNNSMGKWILFMKAFELLLLVPLPELNDTFKSAIRVTYKSSLKIFAGIIRNMNCNSNEHRPKESNVDTFINIFTSCAVLLLSRNLLLTEETSNLDDESSIDYVRMMQTFFNVCRLTSHKSNMIRLGFESEIKSQNNFGLFKYALKPLEVRAHIDQSYVRLSYNFVEVGLRRLCNMMQPVLCGRKEEVQLSIACKLSTQLRVLRCCSEATKESCGDFEKTKELLDCVMKIDNESEALTLVDNVETIKFITEATRFLVKYESSLRVPLILPAQLDMAWSKIAADWSVPKRKSIGGCACIFLFRFLYAFTFLDSAPNSPFTIDPRSLPIKKSLSMVKLITSKSTRDYLLSELRMLIGNHCHELVLNPFEGDPNINSLSTFNEIDYRSLLSALSNSIRSTSDKNGEIMFDKNETEQLFLQAKVRVCDADVYRTVVNAFLSISKSHNPPPSYSFSMLCRDPVVCLKFPLFVWRCRSLRKIALSVLETLLRSNQAIILKESKCNDSAFELLTARDAIVVRCLLAALYGSESKDLLCCSMTTTFIRFLMKSRPSLASVLLKQGLHDRELDWLVENVPETMNDSLYMLEIFSERSYLKSAERLVAADAVLRIAVVHGQSNEIEASQLILNAVSQLVDSFYLILGPVGLFPVDAFFNTETGQLITAAFRILKSLTRLKGIKFLTIRREIGVLVQKFVNLCKGELGGGNVTGRRKQLLKELYDASTKIDI